MKSLVMFICGLFVIMNAVNAGISTELPVSYLGEYSGEPANVRKEAKARNAKVLHFADNVITLGPKQSLQWKMTEPITSGKFQFKGNYGIIDENAETYTLLCTASFTQKNTTSTMKFYLIIMKKGNEIKYLEISKDRSFMLKKK